MSPPISSPTISIDLASAVPAYRQIANATRALLVAGAFRPGDQLPTVRQLALDLGIHHNTVAEAYRVLSDEGWIESRRRLGATVLARSMPAPSEGAEESFARRLRELAAEARADGLPAATIIDTLRTLAQRLKESRR